MPKFKPPGKLSELTPTLILGLAYRLASHPDYPSLKNELESFIAQYFEGKAYVWLQSPHKSITSNLPKSDFPFDPNSDLPGMDGEGENFQTSKIDSNYWTSFPLRYQDTVIGKLFIQHHGRFEKKELDALIEISKISSTVIFAALENHLREWRQRQLNLVSRVTARISQITDLNTLTNEISRQIRDTFNYYYVAVFLIHKNNGRLFFKASAGQEKGDRPEFEQESHPGFDMGEHIIGYVAMTGKEIIANDVEKESRYQAVDSLSATKAEAVIPLKIENQIFGVLDIQSDVKNVFDDDDLLVLQTLANNIAIAIEGIQLYRGVEKKAEQLIAVAEVSRSITHILDINELLQKIVDLIHDRFNFPYVHLYTINAVRELISFKAGSGERTNYYNQTGVSYDIKSEKGILAWVVQNNQTLRVGDVEKEPRYLESPIASPSKGSEMAIPLSFGGEVLGVLDLQSNAKFAFSEEDQNLMETLGDNLAIAIRNAWLYRSEKWRLQVAESLRDVASLLSDNISLNEVLTAILEQLHKNLPCDIAVIWLFHEDTKDREDIPTRKLFMEAYKTSAPYSTGVLGSLSFLPDAWFETVLSKKEPTIRRAGEPIGPIAEHYDLPKNYSAIMAPLSTGDEVLGLLTLVHHTQGRYGEESKKITSAFSSYGAIAIKNARLFAASQEQAWISTILLQVANAIQSLTDLKELTTTIVRLTPMVVGVKGCALLLRIAESDVYQLSATFGIAETKENQKQILQDNLVAPPVLGRLIREKKPLIVQNPQEELSVSESLSKQLENLKLILFPIISREKILGAFLLTDDKNGSEKQLVSEIMTEERSNILQGIIQQTAVAIENIQLIEARQEEAYISAVLLQAAQTTVSGESLSDTLEAMVNILPILAGIDASIIYLWNNNKQQFLTSHASLAPSIGNNEILGKTYHRSEFPILDVVFQNNLPVVHPLIETSLSPEFWDLALPDEFQTDLSPILKTHYPLLMGFPLSVKDDFYGVLLALDENITTNRERRFELLSGIAQQASLAIQNDFLNKEMQDRERLEREFQLAREIQQTFLPAELLNLPGWEMDVCWQTARLVGGDFYDYLLLPNGNLAFLIADVSDKGLAASLYMAVTRTLLRAAIIDTDTPANTLEHVNDLLLKNSQSGLFVTIFYGVLSLGDGKLSYSIAGHNPPFIISLSKNKVIPLQKGGVVLGALPNIKLFDHTQTLDHGDCLVLYTDGVTEAFSFLDLMYGEERFINLLSNLKGKSASAVISAIETDLENFRSGAPLSDDTTIFTIRRL